MCGIYCSICSDGQSQSIDVKLRQLLQNRGRNHNNELCVKNILFGGFVLWQQGSSVTPQPICFGEWILLLNGDIFNKKYDTGFSDTTWLVQQISQCKTDADILDLFKSVKGPYSIIFFNCTTDDLYFARDSLGRNSLIIEKELTHLRILSNSHIFSTQRNKLCKELPPLGLFKVNLQNTDQITLFPWLSYQKEEHSNLQGLREFFSEVKIQESIKPDWLLQSYDKNETFDFYQLCNSQGDTEEIYDLLLTNESVEKSICAFLKLLQSSVMERVQFTPTFCNVCIDQLKSKCNHSKVGILFSGGIDCTILAIVADEFVDADDSIDLINVAFEAHNAKEVNWNVPDRCSARESYEELTRLCPTRNWNLVEVNVTRKELNEKLESHIKHLIYPLNTVLDESLGCAFWFASRGQGFCGGQNYTSPTRVILIGSGADELFGGYTRHRNAFTRTTGSHADKLLSLSNELELDWQRLPSRNLGRDDRVIADNGKTSRAPFIQEDIVRFVRNLQPEQRCCFALAQGVGDKLFLRLSGYQLGLRNSVKLKKRAIQFGSRIANKNQNAKDVSVSIQ